MNNKSYLLKVASEELRAIKEMIFEQKFFTILLIFSLVFLVYYLEPSPPNKIRIAGYQTLVEAIRDYFEKEGFEVESVSSVGSIQNAELLSAENPTVDVAFIQGGAIDPQLASKIQSLGSIAYEPVWIFYKKSLGRKISTLKELAELRVGIGPQKGGTRPLVKALFELDNIEIETNRNFKVDSYDNNGAEFFKGELDAIIVVTPFVDHNVQRLLREPDVEIFNFEIAAAYVKKIAHIEEVTIPKASIDIAKMIPPADIKLIATTTTLAVRKDLNKDLQFLMLVVMKNLNRNPDMLFFSRRQEFPAYVDAAIPASPVALKFYDYGVPEVMRYLPHSISGFAHRFWVLMLSIATVVYTLSKFKFRLRVVRYKLKHRSAYERLLELELKISQGALDEKGYRILLDQLDVLNMDMNRDKVPVGAESEYFQFFTVSELLKNKLLRQLANHSPK
jgi:TRAP-type uncharacterized transport system substrate-binding protein